MAAGLPLQLVVVGGVRDVAQSHAVLPNWPTVLQEILRGNRGEEWAWPARAWNQAAAVAHHVPGMRLLLLLAAALLLQLFVRPQVFFSVQHVAQIIRAQQAGEEAAVGWTGEITLQVGQELRRLVFLSESSPPHLISPCHTYSPPPTCITRYLDGSLASLENSVVSSLKVGRLDGSIIQPGGGGGCGGEERCGKLGKDTGMGRKKIGRRESETERKRRM